MAKMTKILLLEFHQSSTAGLPLPKQNKFPDFSEIYSLIFAGKVLEMEYAVMEKTKFLHRNSTCAYLCTQLCDKTVKMCKC